MAKFLILFLTLSFGQLQLFSQSSDTARFNKIFGCSCCSDTIRNLTNKSWLYIVSNSKSEISSFKSSKKKWVLSAQQIWSAKNVTIDCVEFYETNKKIVLRLYSNNVKNYAEIDPKTGKHLNKIQNKN